VAEILALASAAVFALAMVLQQRVAMSAPEAKEASAGFCGMTLLQLSLQTGVLPPAVATSSIFNPASSVLLGIVLFEEGIHRSALDSTLAMLALLAMFGGIAMLALGRRE
jgi:hypothetical protein